MGVVVSAARALRLDAALVTGPVAVTAMWAVHAGLDWDWEIPGVTLPAIVCMAALVATGDRPPLPRMKPRPAPTVERPVDAPAARVEV